MSLRMGLMFKLAEVVKAVWLSKDDVVFPRPKPFATLVSNLTSKRLNRSRGNAFYHFVIIVLKCCFNIFVRRRRPVNCELGISGRLFVSKSEVKVRERRVWNNPPTYIRCWSPKFSSKKDKIHLRRGLDETSSLPR